MHQMAKPIVQFDGKMVPSKSYAFIEVTSLPSAMWSTNNRKLTKRDDALVLSKPLANSCVRSNRRIENPRLSSICETAVTCALQAPYRVYVPNPAIASSIDALPFATW